MYRAIWPKSPAIHVARIACSALEFPEVHDWNIEETASALDGAVTSADYCDTVRPIYNSFDGHMVLQVRVYLCKEDLCFLKPMESATH
jgi:hypothetical protein